MQLSTILNRVPRCKPFLFKSPSGAIPRRPRSTSIVEGLGQQSTDRPSVRTGGTMRGLPPVRRFPSFPGGLVALLYAARRVNASWCGIRVKVLPGRFRRTPQEISAGDLRLVPGPVSPTAFLVEDGQKRFRTTWEMVCRAVPMGVRWGLAHRDLSVSVGSVKSPLPSEEGDMDQEGQQGEKRANILFGTPFGKKIGSCLKNRGHERSAGHRLS